MWNNNSTLIGYLTANPELKYTKDNKAWLVCSIGIRSWKKDENGQAQAIFANLKAFGKTAETMAQYLQKGDLIVVGGEYMVESYRDKNGNDRQWHGFAVREVSLALNRRPDQGGNQASQPQGAPQQQTQQRPQGPPPARQAPQQRPAPPPSNDPWDAPQPAGEEPMSEDGLPF